MAMGDLPTIDTDVLVVGAGPTGLMAGLVLTRRGVPVVIVDRKAAPTRESRALAVQARTMEIYDQLGVVGTVLAGSHRVTRMQIGQDADPRKVRIDAAQQGATQYPGIHIFEQSRNEELLWSALAETGTDVRWLHRLVDLVDDTDRPDGRVVVLVEGPEGLSRIRARWCVGADGASSTVRRLLDVPFEGVTDDATFWVADLRGVSGLHDDAITVRFGDATFALSFPLGPGGHRRLISLAAGEHIDQEDALGDARSDLGLSYAAVDWLSTYRVHHRAAARFRKRAVFLAGDAAHVHSPVGGQGMNTGLQDAHNLANVLADVAHGHLDPAALERYEQERRPVALRLVKVTDRVFSVIARRGRRTAWVRRRFGRLMASLAPRVLGAPVGARVAGWVGQYRIRYHFVADQAPTPGWADDPAVGLRLPPVGSNSESLRSFTWQLHTYGTEVARPDLQDWITGPHDFGPDASGRLRRDPLYLVRPDVFVAASMPTRHGVIDQTTMRSALHAHQMQAA